MRKTPSRQKVGNERRRAVPSIAINTSADTAAPAVTFSNALERRPEDRLSERRWLVRLASGRE